MEDNVSYSVKGDRMNNHQQQSISTIKGALAIAFGIMFMIFAYTIVVRMILFISGALLFYYGLQLLNIPGVNNIVAKFKRNR